MSRIELDKASLTFEIRERGRMTLKEFLVRGMFRQGANPITYIPALQEISLEVRQGERLGIIGHNGAGKSTLLRMLAGVYPPTSGKRVVEGRISSLFDVTLGFEMDANGLENIRFRAYLQGETPQSIEPKIPEIMEFTELGKFIHLPVRYYSAGMLVRLGFAISTAIQPEILLVDEVLSVGDMSFQKRARQRMREMMAQAQLIVVVSHDLTSLAKFCDRVLWMDHGHMKEIGPASEVIGRYKKYMSDSQGVEQAA
jgi:ABC-type polysaccharide/polyol phosphate transport system ATPase subunit